MKASTPPRISAWTTLLIESSMKVAWLYAISAVKSDHCSLRTARVSCTSSDTATVLAPDSLKTRSPTASLPL